MDIEVEIHGSDLVLKIGDEFIARLGARIGKAVEGFLAESVEAGGLDPEAAGYHNRFWRPIDSLPMDTRALLQAGKQVVIGHGQCELGQTVWYRAGKVLKEAPTHWMPLPEKPRDED